MKFDNPEDEGVNLHFSINILSPTENGKAISVVPYPVEMYGYKAGSLTNSIVPIPLEALA